jgi:hypothetical protein
MRTALVLLALYCLLPAPPAGQALAQRADQKGANGPEFLEYTPEDFLESLEMEDEAPARRPEEPLAYIPRLRVSAPRRLFVGDEPVEVRYVVHVPLNVTLTKADYGGKLRPFELLEIRTGERTPAPGLKRYDKQIITLLARLPAGRPYGRYSLPPLGIPYKYRKAHGDKLTTVHEEMLSGPVEFRKVPLFVEAGSAHDRALIGDPIGFSLEIHADMSVELLNEFPPGDSGGDPVYLSEYSPGEPFILIASLRETAGSEHYRVTRWAYTVAPHGIGEGPLTLAMPHVVWRQSGAGTAAGQGEEGAEKNTALRTTRPGPLGITVVSITDEGDALRGMKHIIPEPEGQGLWLLSLPRAALWFLIVAAVLLALAQLALMLRKRKAGPAAIQEEESAGGPGWQYDWWPLLRLSLLYRLPAAFRDFQAKPGSGRCGELRMLLARRAAVRHAKRRIPVQEASAMTAGEFRALVGETPEVAIMGELDGQLERGEFREIAWTGDIRDVIR